MECEMAVSMLKDLEMREGTMYASGVNLGDASSADDNHEIPLLSSLPTISTLWKFCVHLI